MEHAVSGGRVDVIKQAVKVNPDLLSLLSQCAESGLRTTHPRYGNIDPSYALSLLKRIEETLQGAHNGSSNSPNSNSSNSNASNSGAPGPPPHAQAQIQDSHSHQRLSHTQQQGPIPGQMPQRQHQGHQDTKPPLLPPPPHGGGGPIGHGHGPHHGNHNPRSLALPSQGMHQPSLTSQQQQQGSSPYSHGPHGQAPSQSSHGQHGQQGAMVGVSSTTAGFGGGGQVAPNLYKSDSPHGSHGNQGGHGNLSHFDGSRGRSDVGPVGTSVGSISQQGQGRWNVNGPPPPMQVPHGGLQHSQAPHLPSFSGPGPGPGGAVHSPRGSFGHQGSQSMGGQSSPLPSHPSHLPFEQGPPNGGGHSNGPNRPHHSFPLSQIQGTIPGNHRGGGPGSGPGHPPPGASGGHHQGQGPPPGPPYGAHAQGPPHQPGMHHPPSQQQRQGSGPSPGYDPLYASGNFNSPGHGGPRSSSSYQRAPPGAQHEPGGLPKQVQAAIDAARGRPDMRNPAWQSALNANQLTPNAGMHGSMGGGPQHQTPAHNDSKRRRTRWGS